jgi:hypothetical protein
VGWGERQDVAFSCYGVGAEEEIGEICIMVSASDFRCAKMTGGRDMG